jgi:hypothetical protein
VPTGRSRQTGEKVVELSEVVVGALCRHVHGSPVGDLGPPSNDRGNVALGSGVVASTSRQGHQRGSRWWGHADRWRRGPKGARRGGLIGVEGRSVRKPGSEAPQALEEGIVLARQFGDDVDKFQDGRCFGLVTHSYPAGTLPQSPCGFASATL